MVAAADPVGQAATGEGGRASSRARARQLLGHLSPRVAPSRHLMNKQRARGL